MLFRNGLRTTYDVESSIDKIKIASNAYSQNKTFIFVGPVLNSYAVSVPTLLSSIP